MNQEPSQLHAAFLSVHSVGMRLQSRRGGSILVKSLSNTSYGQ